MSLPAGFLSYIAQYPELACLSESLLETPEVSVRLNASKGAAMACAAERVPWCDRGYYLGERAPFTFDPAFHQGRYYVQDASSMAIGAAIAQISPSQAVNYLDACAAPGGKTTAAIDALPAGSLVVANEYDFKRAEVLAENVAKWGYPYAMVVRGDTSNLAKLKGFFDIVAVDAPCSGEGMMRKDAQAVEQWSAALVEQCAALQRQIVGNAWHALKPGGYMIYSTCTFNRSENEENVAWIIDELGAESVPIAALDTAPGVVKGFRTAYACYRFVPGRVRGEGLFIALLRKPGVGAPHCAPADKRKGAADKRAEQCRKWLSNGDDWTLAVEKEAVYAYPKSKAAAMKAVAGAANAILPALKVADLKRDDAVPAHELAMSSALRPEAFPTKEVSYAEAIEYLQYQAVAVSNAPKGFVLLTYQGRPLGFVKNLGNRANNLYPKNWRILSKSIPESAPTVVV